MDGDHMSEKLCKRCGLPLARHERSWRPIESAPKDGTHVIVADFSIGAVGFGYFHGKVEPVPMQTAAHYWSNPGEEGWYASVDSVGEHPLRVTHWQPLLPSLTTGHAGGGV